MTKAVRIHRTGGPEMLTFEEVGAGEPGRGEVLLGMGRSKRLG